MEAKRHSVSNEKIAGDSLNPCLIPDVVSTLVVAP